MTFEKAQATIFLSYSGVFDMKSKLRHFFLLTFSTLVMAAGTYFFKFPNHFTFGGITGLAVLVAKTGVMSAGDFNFITNMILLIIGFFILGKKFAAKTAYCSILLSVALSALERIYPMSAPLTNQPMLELCFAIALPSLGSAILFNIGSSSGGTDIIAMLVTKYHNVSPGRVLMVCDFCVIAMTLLIYDHVDREAFGGLIYGYVMMGIVSFTVDYVLTGKTQSAQLFIFTDKYDEVARELTNQVHRGVTLIDAKGWYTGQDKKIILIVARKHEASDVLRIAKQIDPDVFMTMAPVMGVFGKGFEEVKGVK